jgi:hypothetical protein
MFDITIEFRNLSVMYDDTSRMGLLTFIGAMNDCAESNLVKVYGHLNLL